MSSSRAALVVAIVLIAGCVKSDPAPRFTPAWEDTDFTGPGWTETRRALLCADCQFNNLFSQPLPERNLSAEAMADTAIRPPQLDMFSENVLSWILKTDGPKADVILHLGDATNLATTGEFERFLDVMGQTKRPWFMAPGNHDVYYFGLYAPENQKLLEAASYRAGEPLDKARFIRRYVAAIVHNAEIGCRALATALGLNLEPDIDIPEEEIPGAFEWESPRDCAGLLHRICWSIDKEKPWRSFILQEVSLASTKDPRSRLRVYLLDSCQYSRPPVMAPNGWRCYPIELNCGLTGEILPDQFRTLRRWLDESGGGSSAVFMSHHPFEVLAARSRSNLGWLWREYNAGMMVSAHTHAGYYAHHDLGGKRDEIELNIGSTTDWPMEWRAFQAVWNDEQEACYLRANRKTLVNALQEAGGFFQRGWEVPLGAPDDYRAYRQGKAENPLVVGYYLGYHFTPYWLPEPKIKVNKKAVQTESEVKDTVLWTHYRLVKMFPTDPESDRATQWPTDCANDEEVLERIANSVDEQSPFLAKIDLSVELRAFERSRSTYDPETGESTDDLRERFKISQAAWASRFMKTKGRRLRIEDDVVRIAWEKVTAGLSAAKKEKQG